MVGSGVVVYFKTEECGVPPLRFRLSKRLVSGSVLSQDGTVKMCTLSEFSLGT